jgi:N-acetylglucosamine-6-sulfatase
VHGVASLAVLRRLPFGLVLTAMVVVAGCGGAHRPPPPRRPPRRPPRVTTTVRRPNVVVVLTDDLSKDLVRDMPHVRRLRRAGATFTRYVVSDSLCCPSRASILTGRLPHDTGVFTNTRPDGGYAAFVRHRDGRAGFAGALSRHGYRTALMGKYLNGYPPGHGGIPPGWTDWAGTGKAYAEYGYKLDEEGTPVAYGSAPRDYLTDVLARRGEAFIDAAAGTDEPFVLELATFAPHRPAVPAPRDLDAFPHDRAPRGPAYDRANGNAPPWLAGRRPLPARTRRWIDRRHRDRARSVLAVDRLLAGVEAHLRADGLDRDTYVVFSSDNGFHMGEHRLLPGKLTAFDTDVRVPLIIAGPGIRPGMRIGALAQNTDLAPTLEALGGVRVPARTDGRSLVPLLRGRTPGDWRTAALIEHRHPPRSEADPDGQDRGSGDPPSYEALRTRHATYVEYADGERELYDDRRDPAQTVNVYGRAGPRRRARLHRRLAALERCHGPSCSHVAPSTA